jgi:hypothetical protein
VRGKIRREEVVVYWRNQAGELMIAPDIRMPPFKGWVRIECETVADIEQFSRRFAAQEYRKFRNTKFEEHMRSQRKRDQLKANCRLRLAQGCISPADEQMTRKTLESLERKDRIFYQMLASEPDLTRASLAIERQEQPTGAAQYRAGKVNGKQQGLADEELNQIAALAGTTT